MNVFCNVHNSKICITPYTNLSNLTIYFAVQKKLTQHCKAAILFKKRLINEVMESSS